jgi:hypothetical protein
VNWDSGDMRCWVGGCFCLLLLANEDEGRKGDRRKRQVLLQRETISALDWHVPVPVTRRGIDRVVAAALL